MGLTEVKLETVQVEGHWNAAIEVGKSTLLATEGQRADTGKYLVV